MKHVWVLVLVIFGVKHSFADSNAHSFVQKLPSEHRVILDWFFRNCLQSFGGYVLCGDKPMCIEEIPKGPTSLKYSEWLYAKRAAFKILKEWHSCEDNEYIFLFCDYYDYDHLIIVNRSSFLDVVNANISLFRYILGSTIKAEDLLAELINNQSDFWNVLKDNKVLIGILLGYGTNNALICSRAEELGGTNKFPDIEQFPFSVSAIFVKPSLGFTSGEEERSYLNSLQECSRDIVAYNSYQIPCFGCEPETEETRSLLKKYEKNRQEIQEFVQKDNFLERVLEKIFATCSGEMRIPEKTASFSQMTNKEDLSGVFAEVIRAETSIKGLKQGLLISSFLKGIEGREENKAYLQQSDQELVLNEIIPVQIECCRNLFSANEFFQRISKNTDWTSLVPNAISYKVLKKGKGSPASSKIKRASFHLSYRLGGEKAYSHYKTIVDADVEQMIPGIARSIIGMQRGEQRVICIHPSYAYGFKVQPRNATFFVELQLIDYKEGDGDICISPIADLEPTYFYFSEDEQMQKALPPLGLSSLSVDQLKKNYKRLLKMSQELNNSKFYNYGYSFLDLIRSRKFMVNIVEFKKRLLGSKNIFSNSKQRDEFVQSFKISVFAEEYEEGKEPPFPLAWF